MAYQAKYWNGSAWVAVANASFDTSGLVKTTGNTGTVDLSGAPVVKGAGMDLIVPTSVTGGTYSASGAITFSAVSTLNVNGCFTSAYDAYRIVAQFSQSVDTTISARMRAAGTDASGANYDFEALLIAGTSITAGRVTAATSMNFAYASTDTFVNIDMHNPALAATTYLLAAAYYGPGVALVQHAARHAVSTAYDGFTFIPASGTITGKIRIYGYHN